MYETSRQSRFDAQYWMLGAGALGRPRGRVWGGRREEGSGWGTHLYLWRIHFDIWQNQYNTVKLKNKIKKLKKIKQTNNSHKTDRSVVIRNGGQGVGRQRKVVKRYKNPILLQICTGAVIQQEHNNMATVNTAGFLSIQDDGC